MTISKSFNLLKYKIARYFESKPTIILFLLNNVKFLKFLLPHDKDYLAMKLICKNSLNYEILDIGGSVGSSILSFRKMGFKNRIIVFEPNEYLVKNYLNNLKSRDSEIEIYNFALGNQNSTQDFFLPFYKKKCLHIFSSYSKEIIKDSIMLSYPDLINKITINKQKLEFKRLDDLNIVSNPHFIKIDAEGYEHEIIKGMLNIIKNYRPYFLVEHNDRNFKIVCELLEDYTPFRYDIRENQLLKISINNIDNKLVNRISYKNKLSSRNIYFIPNENNKLISAIYSSSNIGEIPKNS